MTNNMLNEWKKLLVLEPENPAPLYLQLKERLRAAADRLKAGTLMPSELECMKYASVSRVTVRKAIAELIQEGVLFSRKGKGTFTARRIQTGLNRPEGFTETITRLGKCPQTRVLSLERLPATRDIAHELGLKRSAEIFVLERLRLIDGQPAMLERACLPAHLFPKLREHDLSGSIYSLMRDVYRLPPEKGRESIFAVNADRRLAQLLDVPLAMALLASVRVSQAANGTPLEYTMRHVRADICSYFVSLGGGSTLTVRSESDALINLERRLEVNAPAGAAR